MKGINCIYQFELNDKKFVIEETIERFDILKLKNKEIMHNLYKAISNQIAEILIDETTSDSDFIRCASLKT